MICGYCLHGFGKESLAFVGVLKACGELRLVKEGFYYFYELMNQKGLEPGLEHYRCMFNILIKVGRLETAFRFVVSTPLKWDGKTWSSFLRACKVRRKPMLYHDAVYAIPDEVSDISEWFGATDIREAIELKNDRLVEPGVSWVAIKDLTHILLTRLSREIQSLMSIIK
ncbi:unnamed protein product [Lactuca virosa]|uniref:Pentatricopeptide repeat-containing protein n=1 Tax=Lactuca virosa TaxID=75947 RepID=A0AAU9LY49_9ASTR|nr:unnamed protein product [Lactuca virosa]